MTSFTQRFLIVIVCIVGAIAAGLLIEVLLSERSGRQFGHSQTGHVVGWIGLAVLMAVFIYSVKKRFDRKSGRLEGWFWVHQIAGIVGPMLILIHSGPHVHALVPILALAAMGIVVASGVIGVAVHRKALHTLRVGRKELFGQGLSKKEVEDRLYDLAAAEETFRVWQIIHAPMAMIFLVLMIVHVAGALYFGGL